MSTKCYNSINQALNCISTSIYLEPAVSGDGGLDVAASVEETVGLEGGQTVELKHGPAAGHVGEPTTGLEGELEGRPAVGLEGGSTVGPEVEKAVGLEGGSSVVSKGGLTVGIEGGQTVGLKKGPAGLVVLDLDLDFKDSHALLALDLDFLTFPNRLSSFGKLYCIWSGINNWTQGFLEWTTFRNRILICSLKKGIFKTYL